MEPIEKDFYDKLVKDGLDPEFLQVYSNWLQQPNDPRGKLIALELALESGDTGNRQAIEARPDYPVNGFATIEDARDWVLSFSRWYNTEHKHSGLKFTTPEQRHTGEATAIVEHRQQVYREARARHPNRWSGEIRNWELPEQVWLNPEKEQPELNQAA